EGYSRLYVLETQSGTLQRSPLPDGIIGQMRFGGNAPTLLAFSFQEKKSVQDIWLLDTPSNKVTRYTQGEIGGLHADDLFEPELLRYPSTNGLTIPAFLYKPKGAGRHPVIVFFHGGPEGQMRPWLMPFVQFLVKRGFAVLLPNVRGSDGYGKSYRRADDGIKREESLADIAATFDFVAATTELDATRIGVYGGSYGGYMSLAAATFFPERVKAAVDVVGISSIPTFLTNTRSYRQDLRRAEYGDERDPAVRAVQERISPLASVERIQAALFILHGKNDPRVPRSEAEQIVEAVRERGRPVWYLLALNEGHGFAKKENRDLANLAAVAFFETYLR
ncbi:MAG: alpha/beta hydrolase family protein, partial [Gammaproteobacteria bacterium]